MTSLVAVRRLPSRRDAGQALARAIAHLGTQDPLVMGISGGGVVVAAEVASALGADLDVCIARTLAAPGAPAVVLGAVTTDGACLFDPQAARSLGVPDQWLAGEVTRQCEAALRQERRVRGGEPGHAVAGRVVVLVDDGMARDARLRAAVRSVRARGAGRVVVAVPVAAETPFRVLRREADEVYCPCILPQLGSVGSQYDDDMPAEEAAVTALLERTAHSVQT